MTTLHQFLIQNPLPIVATDTPMPLRAWLDQLEQYLTTLAIPANDKIHLRSQGQDLALKSIADDVFGDNTNTPPFAIFAIGGYGRCELSPKSDMDLLIIHHQLDESILAQLNARLWDIGFAPAVYVYAIDDNHAPQDLSPLTDPQHATALLDARLIVGNSSFGNLPFVWLCERWDYARFYNAKMDEKNARQQKHGYTVQHLEPNIKTGVGGLRAIQLVGWLVRAERILLKRQFDAGMPLLTILDDPLILPNECQTLKNALQFFWQVREQLHHLIGKSEERLLFAHQRPIAKHLGYANHFSANANLAPERLMHDYFYHAMSVHCTAELLYELLSPQRLTQTTTTTNKTRIDNTPFAIIHDSNPPKIGRWDKKDNPFLGDFSNLLIIFVYMGQYGIWHIEPSTLRQLQNATPNIDASFRQNPVNQTLFVQILSKTNTITPLLNLMAKYGILGRYLPDFGAITGLMQYDLFHRYTVDNHTLRLLAIFCQFAGNTANIPPNLINEQVAKNKHFGTLCSLYQTLDTPHLLYIAGLFHDIAKGQEIDHSIGGAIIARKFCQSHGFDDDDTELVGWLVREHLTMSHIAQKKDIDDPEILLQFCDLVGDKRRLTFLYLLTVADMNATNHQLWNDWRATLLNQLFKNTLPLLTMPDDKATPSHLLFKRKKTAHTSSRLPSRAIWAFWQTLSDDYFTKENADTLSWHATTIFANGGAFWHKPPFLPLNYPTIVGQSSDFIAKNRPIIAHRPHPATTLQTYELMVFCPNQDGLFLTIVAYLDTHHYSVLKASITTSSTGFALDNFVIVSRLAPISSNMHANFDPQYPDLSPLSNLSDDLMTALCQKSPKLPTPKPQNYALMPIHKHTPKSANFHLVPEISVKAIGETYHLTIIAKDRPRLLVDIAKVFANLGILVYRASIMTMGIRAEDSFVIGAKNGKLTNSVLDNLQKTLLLVVSNS